MTDQTRHDIPDDLRTVARDLDALAGAERSSAPAGFEQRIALATTSLLREGGPAVAGRIGSAGPMRAWRRMAAAGAIVAGAGFMVLAVTQRVGRTPAEAVDVAAIEADFEAWLAEPFLGDSGAFVSLREELDGFDAAIGDAPLDATDPLMAIDLESLS